MGPEIAFLVHLVVWILVIGLLLYLVRWAMAKVQLPEPFPMIVWVVVAIVLLLGLLRMLGMVGGARVNLFGP